MRDAQNQRDPAEHQVRFTDTVPHFCEPFPPLGPVDGTVLFDSLSNNSIGRRLENFEFVAAPEGPIALAEALKVNNTLTSIKCAVSLNQ